MGLVKEYKELERRYFQRQSVARAMKPHVYVFSMRIPKKSTQSADRNSLRLDNKHQIRRSSYHNVVRVQDVAKTINVAGIQTYIINSARVVFLKERPHPRGKNGENKRASTVTAANGGACKHCLRTLQADTVSFCSIACKARGGGEMTPNAESLRLLEESVMNQHVAVPRNSYKSNKNKETNRSNNSNTTTTNNNSDANGGDGIYNGGDGSASGIGKNGKKRVYKTKVKKEQELMMMLNGGLASLPSQGKPLKKAKKVAAEKEKKTAVKREMVNGDHSSYVTPANSSLGVTPDATPSSRAASVGPNGVSSASAAPATVTGGRKLKNASFRRAAETPSIITPTIPIVPNRRKKFSAPRKSPDM